MAEKEYIERKDLINNRPPQRNPDQTGKEEYNKGYNDGIKAVLSCIEIQPSADVAEVVRCKDCKYYDKEYHQCKLHSEEPDQYSTGFIFCMQEDDFCSYGERKEDGNG